MIELLQPVVNRLKEVFGEDINIYTERQGQGVNTPCFFIKLVDTSLERQFNDFFFLYNLVNIVYMTDKKDQFHSEKIRFEMLMGMEQIQLKHAGLTGDNLNAKINRDGDVSMTVNYNIWLEKVKIPDPLMRKLIQEAKVKE